MVLELNFRACPRMVKALWSVLEEFLVHVPADLLSRGLRDEELTLGWHPLLNELIFKLTNDHSFASVSHGRIFA